MGLIADTLLAAGAFGAAFYCFVLGRRLHRFNDLENGMGGAVAVLSAQVDDLRQTLSNAQQAASASAEELQNLTARAEDVRRQLELQMAALHDVIPNAQPTAEVPQEIARVSDALPASEPEPVSEPGEPMFMRYRAGARTQ